MKNREWAVWIMGWVALSGSMAQGQEAPALKPGELAALLNQAYRQAVGRVAPAVVALKIVPATVQSGNAAVSHSIGSGCIVDPDGYIVTCNHLVRDAGAIEVSLADGRLFPAASFWTDPDTDLAVIRIMPGDQTLPVARFGDSDAACVGDPVLAIGSPFGLNQTVTSGIISSKGRETAGQILGEWGYEEFLQTDAIINQGNSGGPLINLSGEIIGINANILTPTGYSSGYGFAVPSNLADWVAGELIRNKQVVRGYLGAALLPFSLNELKLKAHGDAQAWRDAIPVLARIPVGMTGIMVARITPNSPAYAGGLKAYDVILAVDGKPVTTSRQLRGHLARQKPGTRIACQIWRLGEKLELSFGLAARDQNGLRPAPEPAAPVMTPTPLPPLQGQSNPLQETTPRLGLSIKTLDAQVATEYGYPADQPGVIITAVAPDSPASRARLIPGMILLKVNGQSLENPVNGRDLLRMAVLQLNEQNPELRLTVKYKSAEDLEIALKYTGN